MKSPVTFILLALLFAGLLTGCSTRQEGKAFHGSTEQRLVTHSINHLMASLSEEHLSVIQGSKLHLATHFVVDGQVLKYATERLRLELVERFRVELTGREQADYVLDMFFTSLGTDRDSLGLALPIVNFSDPDQSTVLNLLAIDMYHGISEGYFYLTRVSDGHTVKKNLVGSRVRSDNIATPILSIPISDMQEKFESTVVDE